MSGKPTYQTLSLYSLGLGVAFIVAGIWTHSGEAIATGGVLFIASFGLAMAAVW